jgi:hypothetical protein
MKISSWFTSVRMPMRVMVMLVLPSLYPMALSIPPLGTTVGSDLGNSL